MLWVVRFLGIYKEGIKLFLLIQPYLAFICFDVKLFSSFGCFATLGKLGQLKNVFGQP